MLAMRLASSPPTDWVVAIASSRSPSSLPRAVQQRAAGDGQLHAVRRAAQQLAAQQPLERADLAAERRLREVQPRRGTAEVELLGDGDEGPQVPDLDAVGGLREREHLSAHLIRVCAAQSLLVMRIVHDRHAGSAFPFRAMARQHRLP